MSETEFLNLPSIRAIYSLIVLIGIPVAIIIVGKVVGEALADFFSWLDKETKDDN